MGIFGSKRPVFVWISIFPSSCPNTDLHGEFTNGYCSVEEELEDKEAPPPGSFLLCLLRLGPDVDVSSISVSQFFTRNAILSATVNKSHESMASTVKPNDTENV